MIYFLAVLQILFLFITLSSEQCHERNVIPLTGGMKESSETGYYYGLISTPNFPEPFRTPFSQSWLIDASHHSNGTLINIYLTQMYLTKGVKFFQYPTFEFCNRDQYAKHGPRQECSDSKDQEHREMKVEKLTNTIKISTTCPYLEVQVEVPTLHKYPYRTRDPFLFYVYGFNITFEIVPQKLGSRNDSCFPRNCSNLGHCYLAENWRDFFCDCVKGHPGRYCELSPYCDPEKNITFCLNGGKCRILNSGDGYCECDGTGFTGPTCETRNEQQPQVSARKACSKPNECPPEERKPACSPETSKEPCSCRPKGRSQRSISPSPDWVKYEAIVAISPYYKTLRNQSTIGYEMQKDISNWFRNTNLSEFAVDNVYVRFHSPLGNFHLQELQIHFHGPSTLRKEVESGLRGWLGSRRVVYYFQKLIPLEKDMLYVYTMPRVKYKSIEVSKPKKLIIGKTVSLTCTATTGPSDYFSKRDLRFRWWKDGLPVNTSLAIRHMTDGQTPTNDNETLSILMIDSVSAYDGGTYTCEITDLEFGDQDCGKQEVDVILPPQVEVEPMSLTLEKQTTEKGVVITCTDGRHSAYSIHNRSTEFIWYNNKGSPVKNDDGVVVIEEIIPQGLLLRILKAENSENFTCTGFNKEGAERSKIVEVKVLDSKNSPSCNRHWERLAAHLNEKHEQRLLWEWTAPNSVAKIPCPEGFIGYVQRQCLEKNGKVKWGRSDFSRCISGSLRRINSTLQNAKRGFGDWQLSSPVELMGQLEKYVTTNQVLYPGEGEKVIAIMGDIVNYNVAKRKVNGLFPVFFRTVVKLLKVPNSCVQVKSVQSLCRIVVDMAAYGAMQALSSDAKSKGPHIVSSDAVLLQTLQLSDDTKYQYIFPEQAELARNSALKWLKDKLQVYIPLDSKGLTLDDKKPNLIIVAYKNLSSVLVPTGDIPGTNRRSTRNYRRTTELISPVVQVSIPDSYYLESSDSHIKIHFNLSKEHRSTLSSVSPFQFTSATNNGVKGVFYSCGTLNFTNGDSSVSSTNTNYGGLIWNLDACNMAIQNESYVECQCKNSGIYGLFRVSNLDDEILQVNNGIPGIIIAGFSFCLLCCLLSAASLCVYLKCRISLNTLYILKIFDCFFIFSAVFIVLVGRTEIPSSSWLAWSATACSFLIASLSIQVTKALRVLLMEANPNMPGFVFPWLRNVSQITLLSAITFSTVLPIWTATVAKIIGQDTSNESAFNETSIVFPIFVGIVGLVVLVFLGIYYRAVLKTKGELDGYRQQNPCSASNTFTADMIWVLTYRMKTLNRSLCVTLVLLVMTLGVILYENIRHSIYIQYFLGLSATALGVVLFLSYVSHGEYPLTLSLCNRGHTEKPLRRDPERDSQSDGDGSQRKFFTVSSELTGNGSIVGTTGLLPPPPLPTSRNLSRHLGDESESISVSTVEEQSMDTFGTDISFIVPPVNAQPVVDSKNSRLVRSTSNTRSSTGGSNRSKRHPRPYGGRTEPVRGKCLLSTGEYIMPSNHNSVVSERPIIQPGSSTSSSTSYNYLPIINNHEEIEHKISRDLNILLHD